MRLLAIGKVPLAIMAATLAAFVYLTVAPATAPSRQWTVVPSHARIAAGLMPQLAEEHPVVAPMLFRALATYPVKVRLRVWVFARTHFDAYEALIPSFEAQHPGVAVDLQLVSGRALVQRLRAAFWADLDVPDLVEVEISSAGGLFRGPLDEIGFVDLTDCAELTDDPADTNWLKRSGWYDCLVQQRFGPWSLKGHVFGLPHDVHPVMMAYRHDIFEEEGVDAEQIKTWDDFIRVGRRLMGKADKHGQFKRYMLELSDSWSGNLEVLLFQRGGGYFSKKGDVIFDKAIGAETMTWYVPLVVGPKRIGNSLPGGQEIMAQALEDGYFLCILTPDWRSRLLFETVVPGMKGKWKLMPLPAVRPGGRRTSTLGGTMIGMTKKCKQKKLAMELALHLYYDMGTLPERFANTNILPPLIEGWGDKEFDRERPYWSGQAIGREFAKLAKDTPPQYTSPFIQPAKAKLSEALVACVQYYRKHGDDGFAEFVERTLEDRANYVRRLIERDPFYRAVTPREP